jgi:hypothetical protein
MGKYASLNNDDLRLGCSDKPSWTKAKKLSNSTVL